MKEDLQRLNFILSVERKDLVGENEYFFYIKS